MNVWRGLVERAGLLGKGRKLKTVVIIIKNVNFIYVELMKLVFKKSVLCHDISIKEKYVK